MCLVAHLPQRRDNLPHTLRRPAQKRLRIATRVRVDEPLDVIKDRRVALKKRPATAARTTHPPRIKPLARHKVADALTDRVNRHPRRARHRSDPAPAHNLLSYLSWALSNHNPFPANVQSGKTAEKAPRRLDETPGGRDRPIAHASPAPSTDFAETTHVAASATGFAPLVDQQTTRSMGFDAD